MLLKRDVMIDGYIGKFKVTDYKPKYPTYTDNTKAACPECGTLSEFGWYVPEKKQCRKCKTFVFDQPEKVRKPHKIKDLVGRIEGDFTIVSANSETKTGVCKNGTEKSVKRNSKLKSCNCIKCNPNKDFSNKEYEYVWRKISKTEGLGWSNYYEFEEWLASNKSALHEGKIHLRKIDDRKPYTPDNVWLAKSSGSFHLSQWSEIISNQSGISLLGEDGRYLIFKCDRCHEFRRFKGSISNRSKKEGYTIQCEHCKLEDTEARKNKPKKYIPTPKETVPKSIPSVILLSNNKTWTDGIGRFECSECHTCFEMPMSVFRSKKVCPICKSEQWGKFCDDRIKERFGGKIVRTGVWTNGDTETTWKCLKHGRHYTNKYDRIINSLTGCCPDCLEFTVPDPDAPTTLYYVRLKYDNTHFYKIGITQRDIELRFEGEIAKRNLHIVKEWVYPTWADAYEVEQKIVKSHQGELLCRGERPLRKTGSTEIFYHDVLELDHAKNH